MNFARNYGLDLAIRGGGHSAPGFGTCDDGIVIDFSARTRVDGRPCRPYRAGPGRRNLGDVQPGHPRTSASRPPAASSAAPASPGSPWAAASATSAAGTVSPATTSCRRRWSPPTAGPSRPAPPRTRTCSGPCAAAAATSGSSPPSSTGCTPLTRCTRGSSSTPSTRRATWRRSTGSTSRACRRSSGPSSGSTRARRFRSCPRSGTASQCAWSWACGPATRPKGRRAGDRSSTSPRWPGRWWGRCRIRR